MHPPDKTLIDPQPKRRISDDLFSQNIWTQMLSQQPTELRPTNCAQTLSHLSKKLNHIIRATIRKQILYPFSDSATNCEYHGERQRSGVLNLYPPLHNLYNHHTIPFSTYRSPFIKFRNDNAKMSDALSTSTLNILTTTSSHLTNSDNCQLRDISHCPSTFR